MIFKPKFFLDLGGGEAQKPAVVGPVKQEAAATKASPKQPAAKQPAAKQPAAKQTLPPQTPPPPAAAPAPAMDASGRVLTTAEAIAAELATAQANRPAPSQATFAPDCLTAGGALPRQRRKAGANLATFKEIAKGMMGN
jgi:hypothetical protein